MLFSDIGWLGVFVACEPLCRIGRGTRLVVGKGGLTEGVLLGHESITLFVRGLRLGSSEVDDQRCEGPWWYESHFKRCKR